MSEAVRSEFFLKNFMAPFYGWVQLPQGYSHFEEAVCNT